MSERDDDTPEHVRGELLHLAAERERLDAMLEAICTVTREAVALVDPWGIIRLTTVELARLVGREEATLVTTRLEELFQQQDRLAIRALLARARDGDATPCSVRPIGTTDQTIRLAAARAPRGDSLVVRVLTGADATSTDTLSDVLKKAVDHLDDIVFVTEAEPRDGGRRIVFVNRAFTEITGYAAVEVIGKTPSVTVGPKTDRTVLRRIEARLKAKRSVHEEVLKYKKDGSCYWVELDILPVWDESGKHTHWVSVQRDITRRRSLEAQAIENEHQTAVSALTGRAETTLRPPLRRLKASLDRAILDAARPEHSVKRISASLRAAAAEAVALEERAREIVRDASPTTRRTVDIREVVETAVAVVWRELRHNARLVRDIRPVGVVQGSANQLAQAVVNLLRNAIEALPPRRIDGNEIRIAVRMAGEGDGAAEGERVVEVSDNGVGLAPSARTRATEPFFTTKPPDLHDGLGLTFAASVLRSMGGRVVIEAGAEGGTACQLIIPREEAAQARAD